MAIANTICINTSVVMRDVYINPRLLLFIVTFWQFLYYFYLFLDAQSSLRFQDGREQDRGGDPVLGGDGQGRRAGPGPPQRADPGHQAAPSHAGLASDHARMGECKVVLTLL